MNKKSKRVISSKIYHPHIDGNIFEWILKVTESLREELTKGNMAPLKSNPGRRL